MTTCYRCLSMLAWRKYRKEFLSIRPISKAVSISLIHLRNSRTVSITKLTWKCSLHSLSLLPISNMRLTPWRKWWKLQVPRVCSLLPANSIWDLSPSKATTTCSLTSRTPSIERIVSPSNRNIPRLRSHIPLLTWIVNTYIKLNT